MTMQKILTGALCAASLGLAQAENTATTQATPVQAVPALQQGQVISTTPVVQQIPVQRQVCSNEQAVVQQPKTGAGAAIGAITGGAIGSVAGHGSGATTVLGAMAGAVIGDQAEQPTAQVQNVQRCSLQNVYENRVVAYTVVYTYGGQQYTAQMPYDPGKTIALQVSPAGGALPASTPVQENTVVYTQEPTTTTRTTVVVTPPYPYYCGWPYYYECGGPVIVRRAGPGPGGPHGPFHP